MGGEEEEGAGKLLLSEHLTAVTALLSTTATLLVYVNLSHVGPADYVSSVLRQQCNAVF